MKIKSKIITMVAALSATLLVGCTPQEEQTGPKLEEPIKIEHKKGETTLESIPQRVVSLNNMYVESMVAMDVYPVGATTGNADSKEFVNYLDEKLKSNNVESIGWQTTPNIEKIAELKPDLILATPSNDEIYDKLNQIAPTIVLDFNGKGSKNWTWDELTMTMGKIFDKEEKAEELINTYKENASKVKEKVQSKYPDGEKVMYLRVMEKEIRYYGEGKQGFLYDTLGFARPKDLPDAERSFEKISIEKLLDVNPDSIILLSDKPEFFDTQIKNLPLWESLDAVKNNKIYFADYETWQIGFGPISSNLILEFVEKNYVGE